jgi:hypothetical protein
MEQRRLRLGDILDDYCPRERRVTNHAVVAMIEEDVRQTRCTTCDAEHAYKGARVPRRKRKDTPAVLYKEVLAGIPEADAAPRSEPAIPTAAEVGDEPVSDVVEPVEAAVADRRDDEPSHAEAPPDDQRVPPSDVEDGPVHRPLIRATLPRPEGQKDARPLPEFTIRQAGGRSNGHYRAGDPRLKQRGRGGNAPGGGNGNRVHGGPRFGSGRPAGQGRGPGGGRGTAPGFRSGQQPRHGGKKRSR